MASILNVDKIRAASGTTNVIDIDSSCNTTALTIDTNGRLGQGSPVGFRARVTPNQSISANVTRLSQFEVSGNGGFNTDGAGGTVLNLSTGVMTIPATGYYFYSIEGRIDSFSGTYYYFDLRTTDSSGTNDGNVYARTLSQGSGNTSYDAFTATGVLYLTSGLFLAWFFLNSGDNNVNINSDSFVSLFKLG